MEIVAVLAVMFLLVFMAFIDFATELEDKPECKVHTWRTEPSGKLMCVSCNKKPHLSVVESEEDRG